MAIRPDEHLHITIASYYWFMLVHDFTVLMVINHHWRMDTMSFIPSDIGEQVYNAPPSAPDTWAALHFGTNCAYSSHWKIGMPITRMAYWLAQVQKCHYYTSGTESQLCILYIQINRHL